MSTVYTSKHVNDDASVKAVKAPKKASGNKRKILVVSGIVGAGLIPVAAWAAVQLFGFGSINAAAATTQNLTVDNSTAKLTSGLTPGNTVGAQADVKNPNDFPVTVTGVVIRNSTLSTTPKAPGGAEAQADCDATVQPVGTLGTYPGTSEPGTVQKIAANVTIPAGQTRTVVIPQAVKQLDTATHFCGVHADFAVVAQTAS